MGIASAQVNTTLPTGGIISVHRVEPNWPAMADRPRWKVGPYFVETKGGTTPPSQNDVDLFLNPPAPPPLTSDQKIDTMLQNYGVTIDDLKARLGLK